MYIITQQYYIYIYKHVLPHEVGMEPARNYSATRTKSVRKRVAHETLNSQQSVPQLDIKWNFATNTSPWTGDQMNTHKYY